MQSAAVPSTSNGIKRTAAGTILSSDTTGASSSLSSSSSSSDKKQAKSEQMKSEQQQNPTNSNNNKNSNNESRTGSTSPPPEKRSFIVRESPLKLDTVASAEDLDVKVLRIQNKNLSERLVQRQKLETELRDKIESLQTRKSNDDTRVCVVDRYWTQLDENLSTILERFDALSSCSTASSSSITNSQSSDSTSNPASTSSSEEKVPSSSSKKNCKNSSKENKENSGKSGGEGSQALRNFLARINDWDRVELEDNLKERVEFTTQTVSKLVTNYDRLVRKNEQEAKDLASGSSGTVETESGKKLKFQDLYQENCKQNDTILKCQQKLHTTGIEKKQLEDKISLMEVEIKELNDLYGAKEFELDKIQNKAFKLDRQLADSLTKLQKLNAQIKNMNQNNNGNVNDPSSQNNTNNNENNNETNKNSDYLSNFSIKNNKNGTNSNNGSSNNNNSHGQTNGHHCSHNHNKNNNSNKSHTNDAGEKLASITERQLSELEADLTQSRELSASRLVELEKLSAEYQSALKHVERLKSDLKTIPESVIEQTNEYKHLQTKYSLIVNDNIKLKQALDETRGILEMSRATFQRQLEQMESEELSQQKRLGNEMMQMEEQLAQTRKENELLRIEYEQNVAANEQTGPINKEMRSLITTLQTNNKLVKSDNVRCKKRLDESHADVERAKKQTRDLQSQVQQLQQQISQQASALAGLKKEKQEKDKEAKAFKTEPNEHQQQQIKKEDKVVVKSEKSQLQSELDEARVEIRRLKSSSISSNRNNSPKTDIPSSSAEQTTSMTSSSSSKSDTQSIKQTPEQHHHHQHQHQQQLQQQQKKVRGMEEQIRELYKSLSNKKQEEVALLNDMEITGQAFEDMQEQNIRLMQQLREKDDANFKLVSEGIKLENVQKILKEEKEMLLQQVLTLNEQQEAQMQISKKLEEQFQLLTQNKLILEKEIVQIQQITETYKRQAVDNVQLIHDSKLNAQKYSAQLKEAQQSIADKSELLASQSFRQNRTQEEVRHLQSKLERQKKFEMASNMDEVLKEENREYKEQLRCPSCKVKPKDAVLTKCFHVFCFDCLQKRYDTRQRKCPKCNANFGANDFHKLYLS